MKIITRKNESVINLNNTIIENCAGFQTKENKTYIFTNGHEGFLILSDSELPEYFPNPSSKRATLNELLGQIKWIDEDHTSDYYMTTVTKVFYDFEITLLEE